MPKYVFDSSSLIELCERYPYEIFPKVYDEIIFKMIENGDLFSVAEAYEELRDLQEFWKDYKDCFRDLTDAESENLAEIISSDEFEVFIRWGKKENDGHWADPYLIACAMEDSEIVVVSEESSLKHPQRKIPYVCSQKGIRCIKLLEFFKDMDLQELFL